jgi:hypothetical protein
VITSAADDAAAMTRRVNAYGETPRYWRINALEALWCGHGYDGRPSFWDKTVPLRDRAPAVQAMLPRTVGNRLAHMVFSERSFPALQVEPRGFGVTLTDDEARALSALVQDTAKAARLTTRMRACLIEGLKTGSACAMTSLVEGKPVIEIFPAKHCTPTLTRGGRVSKLVIQYKVPDADGPGKMSWYRREIGDGLDVVFALVPCDDKGEPDWSKVARETEAPIEFVAVRWLRNDDDGVVGLDSIDGHAMIDGLEDEVFAVDMELSQLYRNALYNGDPQMVQTGVDPDDAGISAPQGREASSRGVIADAAMKGWRWATGTPALVKAPGSIWRMPVGGDAKMLESSGAGAQIIKGALEELRRVVTDAMGAVIADPATFARGDLSSKALALLFGPMLDTAADLRMSYGDLLIGLVSDLLRHMAGPLAARDGVRLASWDAARPALAKCYGLRADGAREWLGPPIKLGWGEFFEPSWQDVTQAVAAAQAANGGKPVMSLRRSVAMVAPVVGIDDIDAEVSEIEDDLRAGAQGAREALSALRSGPEPTPSTSAPQTSTEGDGGEA